MGIILDRRNIFSGLLYRGRAISFVQGRRVQNLVDYADATASRASFASLQDPRDGWSFVRTDHGEPVDLLGAAGTDLSDGAWTPRFGAVVNTNVDFAPDGTLTADELVDNDPLDAGLLQFQIQTEDIAFSKFRATVWIQKDNDQSRFPLVYIRGGSGSPARCGVVLNTATGAFTSWPPWVFTEVETSVASDGDWWRVTVTGNNDVGDSAFLWIYPARSQTLSTDRDNAATGSIVVGRVELTSAPRLSQQRVDEARVLSDGSVLVEGARTNLCTYSTDFSSWAGTFGMTAGQDAPDGSMSASILSDNNAADLEYAQLLITTTATGDHTASLYIKKDADQTRFPQLTIIGVSAAFAVSSTRFDTSTGDTYSASGDASVTVHDGGDWWRVEITVNISVAGTFYVRIYPALTSVLDSPAAIAAVTGSVTVFGVQVEVGSFASSYIPTNGAAAVRAEEELTIANADIDPRLFTDGFDFDHWFIPGSDDLGDIGQATLWRFSSARYVSHYNLGGEGRPYIPTDGGAVSGSIEPFDPLDKHRFTLDFKREQFRHVRNDAVVVTERAEPLSNYEASSGLDLTIGPSSSGPDAVISPIRSVRPPTGPYLLDYELDATTQRASVAALQDPRNGWAFVERTETLTSAPAYESWITTAVDAVTTGVPGPRGQPDAVRLIDNSGSYSTAEWHLPHELSEGLIYRFEWTVRRDPDATHYPGLQLRSGGSTVVAALNADLATGEVVAVATPGAHSAWGEGRPHPNNPDWWIFRFEVQLSADVPFPYLLLQPARGDSISGLDGARAGAQGSVDCLMQVQCSRVLTYLDNDEPRIYSDGSVLVEGARTNLVEDSADPWTVKVGVSSTTGLPAPDGSSSAVRLVDGATASAYSYFDVDTASTTDHVLSAYILKDVSPGGPQHRIGVSDHGAGLTNTSWRFDAHTGDVYTINGTLSLEVEDAGDWWRVWTVLDVSSVGGVRSVVRPAFYDALGNTDYTQTGGSITTWGWQLEEGAFPSSYIPTYGAAAVRQPDELTVERGGWAGAEMVREGFDVSVWPLFAHTDSRGNDLRIFDFGSDDLSLYYLNDAADQFALNMDSGTLVAQPTLTGGWASGEELDIRVKRVGDVPVLTARNVSQETEARDAGAPGEWFEPTSDLAVGRYTGSTAYQAFSVIGRPRRLPGPPPPGTPLLDYADATFTRSSEAAFVDPRDGWAFVETGAAAWKGTDEPRIFDDGSVLVEGARTNLIENSADPWTGKVSVSYTTGLPAPDGSSSAVRLTDNATGSAYSLFNVDTASTTDHVLSAYILKDVSPGGPQHRIAVFDLGAGFINTGWRFDAHTGDVYINSGTLSLEVEDAGDWWRVWTRLDVSAVGNVRVLVHPAHYDASGNVDPTPTGDSITTWGWQLEEGAFPTSPIRTSGAAATRAADDMSFPEADVPAAMFDGKYSISVWLCASSDDLEAGPAGAEHKVLGYDTSSPGIYFRHNSSNTSINLFFNNVNVIAAEWGRHQKIDLSLDLGSSGSTVTVSGLTSGDGALGEDTGPPLGEVVIGASGNGVDHLFGVISRPESE